jgi:hypothetical protein
MAMRARPGAVAAALAGAAALACQAAPPPEPPAPAPLSASFDAQRAWADLVALAEIGPRTMGSEGARRARSYLVERLEETGLSVVEQGFRVERGETSPPLALVNVAARIPGESRDVFLLVAPYDTRPSDDLTLAGVNDGSSGAAVLLELARVLSARPLPYTTWLVFLEGEAPAPEAGLAAPPSHFGSRALAQRLTARDVLAQVRLAVVLNRVCDADLRVARDLVSHRIYREEFWRAAARLGRADAFPPGARFEAPAASHQALADAGLRRVVALVDSSEGVEDIAGSVEPDDLEHCSKSSLDAVGRVTLEALGSIGRRLAKIDRFAESPLEATEDFDLGVSSPPAPAERSPEGKAEEAP